MTIVLPTLAVAFAAFCVWLTVRIVNRRERWAKWTATIMVGLPVLYVLSFGPACWWFARDAEFESFVPVRFAPQPYWPIGWTAKRSLPIRKLIGWYATLFAPGNWGLYRMSEAGSPDGFGPLEWGELP